MGLFGFPASSPVVLSLVVGLILALWLLFGLHFDLEASPGWQFVPYFLMLACLLAASPCLGMLPAFCWLGRLRFLFPLLIFLALVFFLTLGWVDDGPYLSFRDARFLPIVVMAAGSSGMVVAVLALFRCIAVVVVNVAIRMGCRGILLVPGTSRFVVPRWLSEADGFEEGIVHE